MATGIPSPQKNETMSPEMDAWLKRAKKEPEREPSQQECINAPRTAARLAIAHSAKLNAHNPKLR